MKEKSVRKAALPLYLWLPVSAVCLAAAILLPGAVKAEAAYDYVVTDYEVNGNDRKSDREEIQSVLNLVQGAKRQRTVYFPKGDYYIDRAPLHIYSNTHIIMASGAVIHRMDSMLGREIIHNVDQNGQMDAVGGYNMSHDITLEGGTWDGGNIAKAKESTDVLRFDHAKNIVVKNCTVKNAYACHLIEFVGIKKGRISGCTLKGFRYGSEKNASEAIQLETAWTNRPGNLADRSAAWAKGSVIDGTVCQQVTVKNNTIIDMPCGIGQHHYTGNGKYRNRNITISGNTFACSKKWEKSATAITCGGMEQIVISKNKITGSYRFGIHITEGAGIKVLDNTIRGSSQNGIMVDSGTTDRISGNTITDMKKHGISVVGHAAIDNVTGNHIRKVKHDGFVMSGGKVETLSGNKFSGVKAHAISITGGTVGIGQKKTKGIGKNVIADCQGNGISVSGKAIVSAVFQNKIEQIKNNGISIVDKGTVYWIINNTINNCSQHGIWNGSARKKAKLKGNKGKVS